MPVWITKTEHPGFCFICNHADLLDLHAEFGHLLPRGRYFGSHLRLLVLEIVENVEESVTEGNCFLKIFEGKSFLENSDLSGCDFNRVSVSISERKCAHSYFPCWKIRQFPFQVPMNDEVAISFEEKKKSETIKYLNIIAVQMNWMWKSWREKTAAGTFFPALYRSHSGTLPGN